MVALKGNKILPVNLEEAVSTLKTVDMDLYKIAEVFFGTSKIKDEIIYYYKKD
jgi:6-phosphofructokinase 1